MEHKIWTPCRVWGGWLGLAPRQREHEGGPLSRREVAGLWLKSPKRVQNGRGDPEVQEAGVQRWAGACISVNKETGQLLPRTRGWREAAKRIADNFLHKNAI